MKRISHKIFTASQTTNKLFTTSILYHVIQRIFNIYIQQNVKKFFPNIHADSWKL